MEKAYIVIVIIQAKSGKEMALYQELANVVEPSRAEPTCMKYHLHHDLNNPAQFVLYEKWQSKEAHEEQFKKPYIQNLMPKLDDLIAMPYQIIFAEDI